MAKVHFIKRRMTSVKNIRQITSAMEMVAASKLARSQEATLASRIYASSAREVLARLKMLSFAEHPFFVSNEIASSLYIVFTSDRGLAGAYTTNVLKALIRVMGSEQDPAFAKATAGAAAKIIMIGKKGAHMLARIRHESDIIGVYPVWQNTIAKTAMKLFTAGEIGRVVLVYTNFHSISHQEAVHRVVLPVPAGDIADSGMQEYENVSIEPSLAELIDYVVPRFIEAQMYHASLEAISSEHASRMLAMHGASENASDLIDSLTLEYNSARQAGVTSELAEIAAGAQAIL